MKDIIDKSRHIIASEATVGDALTILNSLPGEVMTLFVQDSTGRVAGTLTDGDVRRALLSGVSLADNVEGVMFRNFRYAVAGESNFDIFREAKQLRLSLLPELDSDGRLRRVIATGKLKSMLPIDAVLMAGGRGERLRPLTIDTPKPLLKVGEKPIIEYNIENLERSGVENIFVTVNYLHEQIEAHFSEHDGVARVKCVREDMPLGTFGAVALVDELTHDDVLVMNSDLLTDADFEAMYLHHRKSDAALTMGVVPYTVSVPYAIINTSDDAVTGMSEKPTYNYLANAGVYMVKREMLSRIPVGERLDAPDFIETLIADGLKVSYYLIDGTWIDIGSPDDFRYACALMERRGSL